MLFANRKSLELTKAFDEESYQPVKKIMGYIKEFIINSKEDTKTLAEKIAPFLQKGDVIALYGELGTGKTFFTQKLCEYLGVSKNVNSPSYVLMNEYNGKYSISHLDLYRIDSEEEVLELGLHEIFENRITIIEWAEKAEGLLPQNTIHIWFEFDNSHRKACIQSYRDISYLIS